MNRDEYKVQYIWHVLNRRVFNSKMKLPKLKLKYDMDEGTYGYVQHEWSGQITYIALNMSLCKNNRRLLETLVHEMVHQYQVSVLRLAETKKFINTNGHDESFWAFSNKIKEKVGVRLC